MTHPQKITHRIFGTRKNNQIRMPQLTRFFDITHGHALNALKHIEIGKIRNARDTDHRNINQPNLLLPIQTLT